MHYVGDGCYVTPTHDVYACSVDVLPAGELACAYEPPPDAGERTERVVDLTDGGWNAEPGYIQAGRRHNLDPFVDRLNSRHCHAVWYETLSAPPAPITMRDLSSDVPFAALGLHVPGAITFEGPAVRDICMFDVRSVRLTARVCRGANGEVRVESRDRDYSTALDSLRSSLVRMLERATADAQHAGPCALVEVTASALNCLSTRRR